MNTDTPTPRTDEWETYCDESYYHLWRVRRKNERGFNDGYHVHNGEEAKALVDLLNKQDSELTAVTEQRDRLAEALQLFLNRVQYNSLFMDGKLRGGTFDYRSSGFDGEVEHAYKALAAVEGESHE